MNSAELVIIGAGPAGMAAGREAAELGLRVVVLDDREGCGGRIFRDIHQWGERLGPVLTPLENSWIRGRELVEGFLESDADYRPASRAWHVDRETLEVNYVRQGRNERLRARCLLFATGAEERSMIFPGWTLPGVSSLETVRNTVFFGDSSAIPDPVVLAGSGPLLYLFAAQFLETGRNIAAILDARPSFSILSPLAQIMAVRGAADISLGALAIWRRLRRQKIPMLSGIRDLVAEGDGKLQRIRFRRARKRYSLDCAQLISHWGTVPNTTLSRLAGLSQGWSPAQRCWWPKLDPWGNGSRRGIMVAGDGGGTFGVDAAYHSGRIAAMEAARVLGALETEERNARAAPSWGDRDRVHALRPLVDDWFPAPTIDLDGFSPDTQVCSCVGSRLDDIRSALALGATGPNQIRILCGAGGGQCQGRICGPVIAELVAAHRDLPVHQVEQFIADIPAGMVTLGELAASVADEPD